MLQNIAIKIIYEKGNVQCGLLQYSNKKTLELLNMQIKLRQRKLFQDLMNMRSYRIQNNKSLL